MGGLEQVSIQSKGYEMSIVRVRKVEEEVEDPGDLLTLAQAYQEFGIPIKRLSALMDKAELPEYRVNAPNPRRDVRRARRADMEALVKSSPYSPNRATLKRG